MNGCEKDFLQKKERKEGIDKVQSTLSLMDGFIIISICRPTTATTTESRRHENSLAGMEFSQCSSEKKKFVDFPSLEELGGTKASRQRLWMHSVWPTLHSNGR